MKAMNRRTGKSFEGKGELANHIVLAPRIRQPWSFLFDWIERSNELGFPSWFRSFWGKRGISDEEDELKEAELEADDDELEEDEMKSWICLGVTPCHTSHEIDLSRTRPFSNKPIHLGPCRSTLFPIQGCSWIFMILISS